MTLSEPHPLRLLLISQACRLGLLVRMLVVLSTLTNSTKELMCKLLVHRINYRSEKMSIAAWAGAGTWHLAPHLASDRVEQGRTQQHKSGRVHG